MQFHKYFGVIDKSKEVVILKYSIAGKVITSVKYYDLFFNFKSSYQSSFLFYESSAVDLEFLMSFNSFSDHQVLWL